MTSQPPAWYDQGASHMWYPYTQMRHMPEPVTITSAQGCRLYTDDGRSFIDGIASWWTAAHGYSHPYITEKLVEQAGRLQHVMLAGTAHEQPYRLASRLADMSGLPKVFFTDSGSTAIETAMKTAVQYHANKGDKRRVKFACFSNGYHGDTMGCMSLCDPEHGMHQGFKHYMPRQFTLNIPFDEYDFAELDEIFSDIGDQTAAVIIEPLVQGAGGMRMHGPDILAEIARLCRKHGILLIADEVMTGFYRTGNLFACEEAGIVPDMMCVGKALTGGVMTLAAMLASEDVYAAFEGDDNHSALMSGPTYMANALACAVANASLDLFERDDYRGMANRIEKKFYKQLSSLEDLPGVIEVRVKGAICAIECAGLQWNDIGHMRALALKKGVFLRPFGNIVYAAPALNISDEELNQIISTMRYLVMEKYCGDISAD